MAELEIDKEGIAEKVRSGDYYREARQWYSAIYHAPLTDRCFFIVVTALAGINTLIALIALLSLLPISPEIPFVLTSKDYTRELPRITRLAEEEEAATPALIRFFVKHYVTKRESYTIDTILGNINAVRAQSVEGVYNIFRRFVDPQNPKSPITLYERHTTRSIRVVSTQIDTRKEPYTARVVFDATLTNLRGESTSRFVADMTFRFNEVTIDQETSKVSPLRFLVTGYNVKEKLTNER